MNSTDLVKAITASASIPVGQLNFSAINWNGVQIKTTYILATGPSGSASNHLIGESGSWDVSAENLKVGNGQALIFGTPATGDIKAGYTLGGFTFDVIGPDSGERPPIVVGCL